MARLFTAASNEYAKNGTAIVSAVPLTMACWVRLTAAGTQHRVIMEIHNNASTITQNYWSLRMSDTELIRAAVANATASAFNSAAATLSAGVWTHVAAVFTSATAFAAWVNGIEYSATSASITPVSPNVTDIGIAEVNSGSLERPWNGDIAHCGIWNVALTADDIATLADGYSPACVRPDALVSAPPLWGNSSPEPDPFGGFNFTLTGTTKSDSPRIIEPRRSRMFSVPAAAGAGLVWRLAGGRTGRPLAGRGGLAA